MVSDIDRYLSIPVPVSIDFLTVSCSTTVFYGHVTDIYYTFISSSLRTSTLLSAMATSITAQPELEGSYDYIVCG